MYMYIYTHFLNVIYKDNIFTHVGVVTSVHLRPRSHSTEPTL